MYRDGAGLQVIEIHPHAFHENEDPFILHSQYIMTGDGLETEVPGGLSPCHIFYPTVDKPLLVIMTTQFTGNTEGLNISRNFHLPDIQNFVFFNTDYIWSTRKLFFQIHLSDWQFYLPWAVRQWDISSPIQTSKCQAIQTSKCVNDHDLWHRTATQMAILLFTTLQVISSTNMQYNIEHISHATQWLLPGIILCMFPANERRRYTVTSSLMGWGIHRMILLLPIKRESIQHIQ